MRYRGVQCAVFKYVFNVPCTAVAGRLLGIAIVSMFGCIVAAILTRFSEGWWDDAVAMVGLGATGYFSIRSLLALAEKEHLAREQATDTSQKLADANTKLASENERLKQQDAEKTEVLSFASHQMRGPLAVIAGNASLLHDGATATYDPVRPITESARSLGEIVDDFLSFAAIEQGALECEMQEFDVSVAVQDVVSEHATAAKRKGLLLGLRVDSRYGYVWFGDGRKIKHAIRNMVDNAIRYTDAGSVHVLLSRRGFGMQLRMSDTGPGLAPGTEERIFEKFRRGADGRIRAGGSGVGLYLVRRIVEAHGGKVWARSRGVGVGSDFFLTLPSHYGQSNPYIRV